MESEYKRLRVALGRMSRKPIGLKTFNKKQLRDIFKIAINDPPAGYGDVQMLAQRIVTAYTQVAGAEGGELREIKESFRELDETEKISSLVQLLEHPCASVRRNAMAKLKAIEDSSR